MKVLFLDIDGVLNSQPVIANAYRGPDEDLRRLSHLDEGMVENLDLLVELTGCKIVVSSTWRRAMPLNRIREYLNKKGLRMGCIIGQTPTHNNNSSCRGDEIQEWLDGHPEVETFAIVDDNADMGHLADRLVRTMWDHWKNYTSGPLGFSGATLSALVDLLGLEVPEDLKEARRLSDEARAYLCKHENTRQVENMRGSLDVWCDDCNTEDCDWQSAARDQWARDKKNGTLDD